MFSKLGKSLCLLWDWDYKRAHIFKNHGKGGRYPTFHVFATSETSAAPCQFKLSDGCRYCTANLYCPFQTQIVY